MDARQFERVLGGRRRYDVAPLFAGRDIKAVLRRAARADARLARAAEAWERIAPPEVSGRTAVSGFENGVVRVAVSDAATRCFLEGQAAALQERLGRVLAGVGGLRFERAEPGTDTRSR